MTNIDERKKQRIQFFKNDQLRHENFKYGELIIQTNKVQWYLTYIIFLRASRPTKKLEKYLERLELGSLIECFSICIKTPLESELSGSLQLYKKGRNALAHQMFTNKKLTIKECELSIELGNLILGELEKVFEFEWKRLESKIINLKLNKNIKK